MGPTDRVIVLIDMDCFYCQVEEKLNPHLKGRPIAVVQYNAWRGGGIIAVNYPAREQGVTRHMRGNDAKNKCPSIHLARVPEVRGKADLTKYREAGKQVAEVLANFTPLLERASVDEAYLDITEAVREKIATKSYNLSVQNLQNTFVVEHDLQDYLDNVTSDTEFSEDNLKLAVGAMITENIRREVFTKTGYECSAGIAHNKILAKLVCSLHKPNKQTILPSDAVHNFFDTMPINKIKSLGGKFGQALAQDLQIAYMGQLRNFTERELAQKYDEKTANWLYNVARGVDLEPVTTKLISKSIACCKNFQGKAALTTESSVEHWLQELAEELSERLRKDLQENSRKAKQVVVSFAHRVHDKDVTSSRTHPLTSYDPAKIARGAFEIVKKFCLQHQPQCQIKFLGLSAGHFEDVTKIREITSFFKTGQGKDTEPGHGQGKDVFLQLTQELEEDVDKLVFYDDSCRITAKHGTTGDPSRSSSRLAKASFFRKYFGREEEQSDAEESAMLCPQCDARIPRNEYQSHLDYHFALTLEKSDSVTSEPRRKSKSNQGLWSFLSKEPDSAELTETCAECKRKIRAEDVESHRDYHVAKRIHLELNAAGPVETHSTKKKSPRKSKTNKNTNQSVLTFFKRV